jgi:hypothetical protein
VPTLVVIVLFVFLYNLRTAFISAVAIPLSLLAAVLVMLEAGASLNIMVLGGLAIALGEVVDDAIIDCENIYRRLRENRHLGSPVRDLEGGARRVDGGAQFGGVRDLHRGAGIRTAADAVRRRGQAVRAAGSWPTSSPSSRRWWWR